jgi:hypothetical protein
MRTSNWFQLANAKCSWTEQKRRENNGTAHRETNAINSEIAGDNDWQREQSKRASIDKARINRGIMQAKMMQVHDSIRAKFGPRLVRKDGTALYTFQCAK